MQLDLIERLEALRDNEAFPSKEEEDTIEHMDIGYEEFQSLITETITALRYS